MVEEISGISTIRSQNEKSRNKRKVKEKKKASRRKSKCSNVLIWVTICCCSLLSLWWKVFVILNEASFSNFTTLMTEQSELLPYNHNATRQEQLRKNEIFSLNHFLYYDEKELEKFSNDVISNFGEENNLLSTMLQSSPLPSPSVSSPHEGRKHHVPLSQRHQQKFHQRKHLVKFLFPIQMFYNARTGMSSAIAVNSEWAYRHIFKNGGTTIEMQAVAASSNRPRDISESGSKNDKPVTGDNTGVHKQSLESTEIQRRQWFTLVRDPIDHFLSGWAECGVRRMLQEKHPKDTAPPNDHRHDDDDDEEDQDKEYNRQILDWLHECQQAVYRPSFYQKKLFTSCTRHSLPQANFLIRPEIFQSFLRDQQRRHRRTTFRNQNHEHQQQQHYRHHDHAMFENSPSEVATPTFRLNLESDNVHRYSNGTDLFYPQLKLVGDLQELSMILNLVGLPYNSSVGDGRVSSRDEMKRQYFRSTNTLRRSGNETNMTVQSSPRYHHRRRKLFPTTLQAICNFVALDYFLFDFEPPIECFL